MSVTLTPGFGLEQLRAHVAAGADRRGAEIEFARVLLRHGDEVAHRLGRERRIGQQHNRHGADQADRREVLARVEPGVNVEARIDRDRSGVTEQQRVAVRRRLRDDARADGSAAAGPVVDHDLLAERFR